MRLCPYLQLLIAVVLFAGLPAEGSAIGRQMPRPKQAYIENRGQWDSDVLFLAQTPGLDVWITRTGVVYDAFATESAAKSRKTDPIRRRGSVVHMEFANASRLSAPLGKNETQTRYSYFTENGTATDVRLFGEAVVERMYDGVDVVFYFDEGVPRYDCIVQPGADYSKIAMVVHGTDSVRITEDGSLALHTKTGVITQRGLAAYQVVDGSRTYIPCSFVLKNSPSNQPVVGFSMGAYDPSLPVVIDPFVYTVFLGGSERDELVDIAIDQGGNLVYVVGTTVSPDFPELTGSYDELLSARDVVLTRLSHNGVDVVFSTFYGGSGDERAFGLARDKNGYLYIVGETESATVPGMKREPYSHDGTVAGSNVFVVKMNGIGTSVQYATMIGGDGDDRPAAITVDDSTQVYVVGTTRSNPFPTYNSSVEPGTGGSEAFLFSLNAAGNWRYSTIIGGTGNDSATTIAMDPRGSFFWVGGVTTSRNLPTTDLNQYQGTGDYHMFFARYRTWGERVLLGYAGVGTARTTAIAVDGFGDAFLAGYTPDGSFELPVSTIQPQYDKSTPVNGEGILLKLTTSGTVVYSTYLGAGYDDIINDIAVDRSGAVVMVGSTNQDGIRDSLFYNPKPDQPRNVRREGFVAVLTPGERLLNYSTYLGGSGDDECVALAIARDSSLYIVGNTTSEDLHTEIGSEYKGKQDGMVAKIEYMPKVRFADEGRTIDFDTVYIGDSKQEIVTFLNTGTSPNELEKITFSGSAAFTSGLVLPSIIPVGVPVGELPVEFTFSPTTIGTFTATVKFEVLYLRKTFTLTLKGVCVEKPPPVVLLEPDTLDIGQVFIGEHGERAFVLSNRGRVNAAVRNIVVSGGAEFSYNGPTAFPLGVDGETAQFISFDPTVVGVTSAIVVVSVERSTTPLVMVVKGEGMDKPRPDVYLETYEKDFGKVQLGRSKKLIVVVSNTGQTSATLSVANAAGPFMASLDATVLKPGSSIGLEVIFSPDEVGSTEALIDLQVEEVATTLVLKVTGEGVLPLAVVTPRDTVDFGDVKIGESEDDKIFIRNTGIDTIRVASVAAVGGDFIRQVDVPFELGVGEELEIDLGFAPSVQGFRSEAVAVTIDHLPDPIVFVLKGTGIQDGTDPRGIAVDPDTLDYGTVYIPTTATRSFVITNVSTTQSIEIEKIEIVPSGSGFTLVPPRPSGIAAGESYTVFVDFTPATTGTATADVIVTSTVNTIAVALIGMADKEPAPVFDTVRIVMPDINAKIGEYAEVQLSFAEPEQRDLLQQAGVTGFRAVLRWNSTVMIPVGGHSTGTSGAGEREVTIESSFSGSDPVFYRIPVRILWGNAEYADIRITDMKLLPAPGQGSNAKIIVDRSDTARLHITDIWHDRDGPRLINPNGGPLRLSVSPNPFEGETVLSVENARTASSLVIYNLVGETVIDLSSNITGEELIDIPLSAAMFPGGGIYYCRLVSGTHTLVRTIILRSRQ